MDRVTVIGDRGASGQGRGGTTLMRGDGHRHAMAEAANDSRGPIHAIDDVAIVLGMPEGELPPAVQARIVALMEEVERLRAELAQVRRHEDMLRDLADHHPTLHAQHRRTFLRELTRLVAQADRSGLPGTVVYFHIAGIETLRDAEGRRPPRARWQKRLRFCAVKPIRPIRSLISRVATSLSPGP